ncbi:hypothetical protein [Dictyobacter kobayashii]|uniref:DUF4386 domain-containing protein n=1 Tax=Dictyobacter kobayashii TaxID=2014872 RepID=A0A402AFB9_9CHLR|nr:hypothetical protein [Dictyobacter kobayashii]GCE17808.1 hypothetical protein KDK_16080 [Dictyobacter kobayashii]
MKRSLLARLRSNGLYYIIGGLLLLLGIPLYQVLILGPTGFSAALDATGVGRYTAYLAWISTHSLPFVIYRVLLLCAFFLLISFPFNLHRIIVAQELMAQQEREEEERQAATDTETTTTDTDEDAEEEEDDGLPEHPWRGKGFVVLAAWLGLIGLSIYLLGAAASTIYFMLVSNSTGAAIQGSVITISPILSFITNVVGTGLIGLACLFFGGMIARTGKNLWPGAWVAFGYAGLFIGAMLCISAVAVMSAAGNGQSTLTTLATLLFAIWIIWLGIMLVRLKPEP